MRSLWGEDGEEGKVGVERWVILESDVRAGVKAGCETAMWSLHDEQLGIVDCGDEGYETNDNMRRETSMAQKLIKGFSFFELHYIRKLI